MTDEAPPEARESTTILGGLTFPESPRWHDGRLWFLEIPSQTLRAIDPAGREELIERFEHRPSAFDFLPDGSLIIAFGQTKQLVRLDDHSLYADLSHLEHRGAPFQKLGDMVIDQSGRVYIGCARPHESGTAVADLDDALVVVDTTGEARIAATGVASPNGVVITPDGDRLILAESLARRLVEWDITGDGSLTNHRVFATVGNHMPDGICVDSAGAVWVTGLHTGLTTRVHDGGLVSDSVRTEDGRFAIAAMLGGPDRRDLYVVTCKAPNGQMRSYEDAARAVGYLERTQVDIPGAGWPGN